MKVLINLLIIAAIAVSFAQASRRFHGNERQDDHQARRGHRLQHGGGRNRCDLSNSTLDELKEKLVTKIDRIVTKNTNLTYSGNVINEAIRNGSLDTVILQQINGTQEIDIENETDGGSVNKPSSSDQKENLDDTDIGEDTSIESSSSITGNTDDEAETTDDNAEDTNDQAEDTIISKGRKEKHCCFFKLLKSFSKVEGQVGVASQNILDSIKSKGYRGHRGGGRRHGGRHWQQRGHSHTATHHHQQVHRYGQRTGPETDQEEYNAANVQIASP